MLFYFIQNTVISLKDLSGILSEFKHLNFIVCVYILCGQVLCIQRQFTVFIFPIVCFVSSYAVCLVDEADLLCFVQPSFSLISLTGII